MLRDHLWFSMNLLDSCLYSDLGAVIPMARTATLTAAATEVATNNKVAMAAEEVSHHPLDLIAQSCSPTLLLGYGGGF